MPRNALTRRALLSSIVFSPFACAIDSRELAPRFHAKSLDGERFDNESLRGNVVLIQMWTTWCQYCRRDQPAVDAIAKDFAGKGLVVLAVNAGEAKKKVRKFLEDSPREGKVVLMEDTNLAALYAVRSFPFYVVIDRQGRIAGTQKGAGGESVLLRILRKAGLESNA